MQGIIYKVTCKTNKKVYIGQTIETLKIRKSKHQYRTMKGDKRTLFQCALLDEGFENFTWEQIDIVETKEELDQKEKYWISFFKSNNKKYGYNSTDGGISYKVNEVVKKKLSVLRKGIVFSNETKQKMRVAQIGKKQSKEQIEKRVKIIKGKKRSEEQCINIKRAKQKCSSLNKEKVLKIKKALKNGISCTELAKKYNVSISCISLIKNNKSWIVVI